tara:strand:- start:2218 stop:2571 length:354 start_codon:yes stop_codon:yes gene_type:complete
MSRDSYSDYSTFQQRKLGNCFYNLAKEKYDLALLTSDVNSNAKAEAYTMSIINAQCAILFNRNDVEAKELIKKMCNNSVTVKYTNLSGSNINRILTTEDLKEIHKLAVTKYRNLGYC